MNEFTIIQHYFAAHALKRTDVTLGIGDDAAIITPPHNQQIVITTDTLVSGIHFPTTTSAYDIGYKALAVNLSDLAAMGATPAWLTLSITLPNPDETWLHYFSEGFFALANQYNAQLIGGDLTRGPLTITIQAHGLVPTGQAIRRSGAKFGDLIYVTDTLGDAALGLTCAQQQKILPPQHEKIVLAKLNRPSPKIRIGEQLRGIASAAIDISDGFAADLTHILESSHVGAEINIENIPLSYALKHSLSSQDALHFALCGGDDYELCFTVPPEKQYLVSATATQIGHITNTNKLDLRYADGTKYSLSNNGYQHF